MSQSYVDQVTIDCLLNKNVINQYIKNASLSVLAFLFQKKWHEIKMAQFLNK